MGMDTLKLAFGLTFSDLYERSGIERIDRLFLEHLHRRAPQVHERLAAARARPEAVSKSEYSRLLVDTAPHLDAFLGQLFGIEAEVERLNAQHEAAQRLYRVKRQFVQRRALHARSLEEAGSEDGTALALALEQRMGKSFSQAAFARHVERWLAEGDETALALAERYSVWAVHTAAGRSRHAAGTLFKVPAKLDPARLVDVELETIQGIERLRLGEAHLRRRDGFRLTDPGMGEEAVLDQANYCIWCHGQSKDSCSTGLRDKGGGFRLNALGAALTGCPLEEKISEMNFAKAHGASLGALAIVTVDNPLAAATGHRICNDCMKACIYQKQEPVDIPQIETRVLKDVLALPWGFEIYSLLTRWVPLHLTRPVPRPETGYKVLVVGQGPAGFNLAHHLLNEGHTVVAVDGLKIEPLPESLSGVTLDGRRVPFQPIRDVGALWENLSERVMAGFGGVAEYGITVRWDKNFLKLVRLLLERRKGFALFGGVRFGGTFTPEDALALGFDHIALATGAGRPTVVPMENALARGVRMASDFLMALQLTGAARSDSIANLQIRLPAVVIGGGLTAIDAATETLAYYPVQVEKFLARYETLAAEQGEAAVRAGWSVEDTAIAEEFIAHARAIRAERAAAAREGRAPRLRELLDAWGGVTIVYRRRFVDAPSYRLNHEEVRKAMEEGVRFAENLQPVAVVTDAFGAARALRLKRAGDGGEVALAARTVLIAAGTQPNTVLARELPGHLPPLDGAYYQAFDENGQPVAPERSPKPAQPHVLMALFPDGRAMSFWGDLHPSYAGNVVKAMAGAKQGYPVVTRKLQALPPEPVAPEALLARLNRELRPTVHAVHRLTPTIVEVVVRAPMAARRFRPGQFYRLQNFEACAPRADRTCLAMEGLALTGAWVDEEKGLLSLIVLEMGGSSDVCSLLRPGEPVVVMGPTGAPTEIPADETVLLAGGGLGNAVLFSIGQALRANGCRVLYFAGYKRLADRYHVERIEEAADVVVWCCDEAPGFIPRRPQDRAFVGNIVQAMEAYARGELGEPRPPLSEVDRIIAIGSDRMMAAVAEARTGRLAPYLKPGHVAIGSINSPMQCMMKEICGQCLQLHRDTATGREKVVFSCFSQDQPLDQVSFACLAARLSQNALQEKLTARWVRRCLGRLIPGDERAARQA